MKNLIIVALADVFFMPFNVIAYGATTTDVFQKYGLSEKAINIEALKDQYELQREELSQMTREYYRTEYLSNAGEVISQTKSLKLAGIDIEETSLELQRLGECLDAMVRVDASYEEIFDVEKQYRRKQKELNEKMVYRSVYSADLLSYGTFAKQVSSIELKKTVDDINSLQNQISKASAKEEIGSISDLKIPTKGYFRVTSKFGNRTNPITGASIENHSGLDLAAPKNTEVMAVFKGVVAAAQYSSTLGNYVILDHGDGLQTLYGHMNSLNVKKGDKVEQYDTIGFVGTTGSSTGYHLHLGVYIYGVKMNPEILFKYE